MDVKSDKRLAERARRGGDPTGSDLAEQLAQAPDLSDRVRQTTSEELERLRSELVAEQMVRAERVQRRLEEHLSPPVKQEPIVVPVPESEL